MTYLRNTWYVAAWDDEVDAGTLLSRRLLPMLEVQQRSMGEASFWSLKPVLLPSDAPAVRARRVLDGLIKAEASTTGSSVKEPT